MTLVLKIMSIWGLSYLALAFINLEPYWALIENMDYTALRALWVLLCTIGSIALWFERHL